ncbi:MAG: hypothetical protein LBK92_02295 [Endomicrobium sp.]|jgi:hypothetical protein|nr:hypothetical protein [Endomicrobium sp.]
MNDDIEENLELPGFEEAENLSVQEAFRKFIEKIKERENNEENKMD